MTEPVKIGTRAGRKLRDTVFTDKGLRLDQTRQESRSWFIAVLIGLPATVFVTILLW